MSAPMLPPAPPRLSMITGLPQIAFSWFATSLEAMSFTPPGGKGTTSRTGRSGKRVSAAKERLLTRISRAAASDFMLFPAGETPALHVFAAGGAPALHRPVFLGVLRVLRG